MLANHIPMPLMDDFHKTFGTRFLKDVGTLMSDPSDANQMLNDSLAAARAPQQNTDMDILSIDTYPSAPIPGPRAIRSMKRKASHQFYGGVTFNESGNGSSNSSNEAPPECPPKKRSKRPSKSEEEEKKQRGRPRLDTRDETPADRRRTQIRLAQRAYRHRKEITITALKRKVEFLQKTIESMSVSYINLHDNIIDTGLLGSQPALVQQLKETADEFAALADQAADSENDDEDNEKERSNSVDGGSEPISIGKLNRSRVDSKPQAPASDAPPLGYELAYGGSNSDTESGIQDLQMFESQGSSMPSFQQYNVQIPEQYLDVETLYSTIEKPLKATQPYTYSFQETTFSRRLHRLCLERAFRNLTNPHLDREYIQRAFRFTFCFSNKKNMLIRFQELLKRKAGESLENWNVPFFHIGGAGTHFPRRDENGLPVYPPNMHSPSSVFRPLRWLEPETPRTEQTTETMLDAIGYGGEWFDSHDVEQYLKSHGIQLDGTSSFVEVDPLSITLPALNTHSDASTPILDPVVRTPSPVSILHLEGFLDNEVREKFGNFNFMDNADKPDFSTWQDQLDFGFAQTDENYVPTLQDIIGQRTTPVTVDVSKFLERMVDGAACLGRAPGFRKQHIDNALALSLQEAF